MIKLPHKGRFISRKEHNCDDIIMLDWIEACIGFREERLSCSDITDILLEEEIYIDQDFANAYVNDLWEQIAKREKLNKDALFYKITGNTIKRKYSWNERLPHAFCLLLSLKPHYDTWKESSHNEQGELFERLVKEAITTIFSHLNVYHTGWTKKNSQSNYFKELVNKMKKKLNLSDVNIENWDSKNAKDYGLDILAYTDLNDNRCGLPYYMMQCASGNNWKEKLKTPDLAVWKDILIPGHFALRAFAMPFCIKDDVFYRSSIKVEGLFLDRTRILKATEKKEHWLSSNLQDAIKKWIDQRIDKIIEEE